MRHAIRYRSPVIVIRYRSPPTPARPPALVGSECEAEGYWDGTKRDLLWLLRSGGQDAADQGGGNPGGHMPHRRAPHSRLCNGRPNAIESQEKLVKMRKWGRRVMENVLEVPPFGLEGVWH